LNTRLEHNVLDSVLYLKTESSFSTRLKLEPEYSLHEMDSALQTQALSTI